MPSVGSKTFENIHRGDVIIYELDSTIKPFVQACGLKADPALSNGTQERCYYLVLDKEYEPKRILKCVALIPPATLQGRPSPVLSGKKYFDGAAGKSCFIIVSNFVIINDVRDSTVSLLLLLMINAIN